MKCKSGIFINIEPDSISAVDGKAIGDKGYCAYVTIKVGIILDKNQIDSLRQSRMIELSDFQDLIKKRK